MLVEFFGSDFILLSGTDDYFPVMLTQTGLDSVIFKRMRSKQEKSILLQFQSCPYQNHRRSQQINPPLSCDRTAWMSDTLPISHAGLGSAVSLPIVYFQFFGKDQYNLLCYKLKEVHHSCFRVSLHWKQCCIKIKPQRTGLCFS